MDDSHTKTAARAPHERNTALLSAGLDIFLVWTALAVYLTADYYRFFLPALAKDLLVFLSFFYTFLILFSYAKQDKDPGFYGLSVFIGLKHYIGAWLLKRRAPGSHARPQLEARAKTALLLLAVKFFFIPIMLAFTVSSFGEAKSFLFSVTTDGFFSLEHFVYALYPALLSGIFFLDTLIFSFGYLFESKALRNEVRSVEPTLLGWAVTLVCYPPFNGYLGSFLPWYANDYVKLESVGATAALYTCFLLLFLIFLSASITLGTKASNLTNRGIVTSGPYAYVRHPHYASKNLVWWISILPIFSLQAFFAMFVWTGIYYLRAITEERHLLRDPDYQAYCKKVRYRFIPYVF